LNSRFNLFKLIEDRAAEIILLLLAFIPCIQMAVRVIFSTDIPGYDSLIKHLTLWAALIAGMICTKDKQHISLGFSDNLKDGKIKSLLESTAIITGSAVSLAVAMAALSFSIIGCLLYTSPSPRDVEESRMPSSA